MTTEPKANDPAPFLKLLEDNYAGALLVVVAQDGSERSVKIMHNTNACSPFELLGAVDFARGALHGFITNPPKQAPVPLTAVPDEAAGEGDAS